MTRRILALSAVEGGIENEVCFSERATNSVPNESLPLVRNFFRGLTLEFQVERLGRGAQYSSPASHSRRRRSYSEYQSKSYLEVFGDSRQKELLRCVSTTSTNEHGTMAGSVTRFATSVTPPRLSPREITSPQTFTLQRGNLTMQKGFTQTAH